jgi:hypothetical protein
MPESVTDRPTKSHEYLFLLSKSPRYYYDNEAIKESASGRSPMNQAHNKYPAAYANGEERHRTKAGFHKIKAVSRRNKRSVWTVSTRPYKGAHFATFPAELVTPCILAGTSSRGCCPACGAPWVRVLERTSFEQTAIVSDSRKALPSPRHSRHRVTIEGGQSLVSGHVSTSGWQPSCDCDPAEPVPCTVLDPFSGSATTGEVSLGHGRHYLGLDLSEKYLKIAISRIHGRPSEAPGDPAPTPQMELGFDD